MTPLLAPWCFNLAQEAQGTYPCSRLSWSQIKSNCSFPNNFLWVEAFQLGKRCMYQVGATFFSSLTTFHNEKAWKIGSFWQIFTWMADGSHYPADFQILTQSMWMLTLDDVIFVRFLRFIKMMSSECIKPSKVACFPLCSQKWPVLTKFSKKFGLT